MLRVVLLLTLVQLSISSFDPELHAKYLQLPREQFIHYFNSQNYTWKIRHHPHLEIWDQDCEILSEPRLENLDVMHHDPRWFAQLPENFDAREKWANCETIKEIYNQGQCGSCWAFATATIASDRTCISKGLNVRLSQQDFTCLKQLCYGGRADRSFPFWRDEGLVTQECRPYDISAQDKCVKACIDPSMDYNNDKHFAEKIYTIASDENGIKTELFINGPIYAGFTVYTDFYDYKSGVYEHKYGFKKASHAVRVIGYGVENDVDYWLVANSWGTLWGDRGFFKIKRYQQFEVPFESRLYTGQAKN